MSGMDGVVHTHTMLPALLADPCKKMLPLFRGSLTGAGLTTI
jgi:hypothetical protein